MNSLRLLSAFLFLVAFTCAAFGAPGDPIPHIDITVEQSPPSQASFGGSGLLPIPADFFGPGSEPFVGGLLLWGQCRLACGGCDDDCNGDPDGRIDFVETSSPRDFETEMVALSLHSASPIPVLVGGVDSFFDVEFTLSGLGPSSDAPITGAIQLPEGGSLPPGSSSFVVDSFFDIEYRIEFRDATTGAPAGSAITETATLHLVDVDLPVVRLSSGEIVLGAGGETVVPFTYASPGGGIELTLKAIIDPAVGVKSFTWGDLKSSYR